MIPNILDGWDYFLPITQKVECPKWGYNIDRWIKLGDGDKNIKDVEGAWDMYIASLSPEYVKTVKL